MALYVSHIQWAELAVTTPATVKANAIWAEIRRYVVEFPEIARKIDDKSFYCFYLSLDKSFTVVE